MKVLSILLALSLAANAGLWVFGPGSRVLGGGGTSGMRIMEQQADVVAGGAMAGGKAAAGATRATLREVLRPGNEERLRDEMRAAGLDDQIVRAVVGALIWKRYEARMKALQPNAPKTEWWKDGGDWWGGQTKEQRAQMKALQAEIKAERLRLLGKDPEGDGAGTWLSRQYGFLPGEKREALQQLEQDYNELGNELREEMQGFTVPADAEKTRFLQEEKKRDLALLLTPQELEAYELRQSGTARNLRWQMTQMNATEAEFKAIFEIKKEFDDQFNEYDSQGNRIRNAKTEDRQAREAAEKAMKAQLKQALGPERYLDYLRSNDHDYRQLRAATKRFGLAPDTPNKIYALREQVPQAALKIADDPALTPEQKKAEVARLGADARARAKALLGADVAQAFFDQNGMQWVQQLERGTIITYDEEGGQKHRRLDEPVRSKPPAPKAK